MNLLPHSIPGRLGAVGLLVLVVFLAGTVVIGPLWERYTSKREVIAELESQLVRFEAISEREPLLANKLAELKKRLERSGLMIEAKSATLASASLQERIKQVVAASGGTLASTQVLFGKADGEIQRVSVNARMTGSVAEVQSSLYGLESTLPVLVVDDLLIVTRRARARQRGQDNEIEALLDTRFQVTGFYDTRTTED